MSIDNLQDEIISDFLVTKKRKKIWLKELDIMKQIENICEKHDIKYYVGYGSLLGAVRHKGNIPWDDDLDIIMIRDEYERFLKIAEKELGEGYIVHVPDHMGVYYRNFSRIRDCNSTAISGVDVGKKICHGIFVDVMPFDIKPDSKLKWWIQKFGIRVTEAMINTYVYGNSYILNQQRVSKKIIRLIVKLFTNFYVSIFGYEKLLKSDTEWRTKYNGVNSKEFFTICYNNEPHSYPRHIFASSVELEFENTTIKVPIGYKEMLSIDYGDYMKLPSIEERGKHHEIYFDTDKPYTEYMKLSNAELWDIYKNQKGDF